MDSTSIIVGYIHSNEVYLQQATCKDKNLNFYGLPPPLRCEKCYAAAIVRYFDLHMDRVHTIPDRVLALCNSCGASTHEYTAPLAVRFTDAPDVFFWNLPLAEQEWEWVRRDEKKLKSLRDTKHWL